MEDPPYPNNKKEMVNKTFSLFRKRDSRELKYIRIVRGFLWFIGAWPGEILGERVPLFIKYHRIQVPIHTVVVVAGQVHYLVNNYATMGFFDIGHVYITTFLATVTAIRTALPWMKTYSLITKDFLNEFHLLHHKHKGEYYAKISGRVDQVSLYFSLLQMALMLSSMLLFNMTPFYNNYKTGAFADRQSLNSTVEFSVFYSYPGFKQENHFYAITVINCYLSYICGTAICSMDLLLFVMVFQILGHISILKNNLESLPKPKSYVGDTASAPDGSAPSVQYMSALPYDQEENKAQKLKIIEIVQHHIGFADAISSFFGPMLAVNYLFHLVSGCVLLLECSQLDPDALIRFVPLTVIIFGQLVQVSVVFEVVDTMSATLGDAVYGVPWECMSVDNRRCLRLLLQRVQRPIQLTAMGIMPVGVKSMGSILKTTFSYFLFLQRRNERV